MTAAYDGLYGYSSETEVLLTGLWSWYKATYYVLFQAVGIGLVHDVRRTTDSTVIAVNQRFVN